MELVIAGISAGTAGAICNPLEVVKIRMQLQGELKARGQHAVYYRNVFHAFYIIGAKDGILALQKGLIPNTLYQSSLNSVRLGLYQLLSQTGFTRNSDGSINTVNTLLASMACGAAGGVACSPFYLVKTHLQSKSNEISIAVGHQHEHRGMFNALHTIYKEQGVFGLWRGVSSQIPRIAVASAAQLTSFEVIHEFAKEQFPGRVWVPLCIGSFGAGFFVTVALAPFDVVATRFYNQGVGADGRGLVYRSAWECAVKTGKSEGIRGFFKGSTACYFRMGPYTMLVLVIWDRLKDQYKVYLDRKN